MIVVVAWVKPETSDLNFFLLCEEKSTPVWFSDHCSQKHPNYYKSGNQSSEFPLILKKFILFSENNNKEGCL